MASKSLKVQLGLTVLASLTAAMICGIVASLFVGISGLWLSLAAGAVSLPVGALVVRYSSQRELSAELIVATMMARVGLTAILAGVAALCVGELRSPVFFLAIGVVYLANLSLETWFALSSNTSSRRIGTPV